MMNFLSTFRVFFFILCFSSCNDQQSSIQAVNVKEQHFSKFINHKPIPKNPNLNQDKTIGNPDYPIEIALYQNNDWFYDLPNLGTGKGKWRYENGKLYLSAKRTLFNMYISVIATKENADEVVIEFSDRFGLKVLKAQSKNLEEFHH